MISPDGGTRIERYLLDGQLASITGSAVAPVRYQYEARFDEGAWRMCTTEIKLDHDFADTPEWTQTFSDGLGRIYKTVTPSGNPGAASQVSLSFFNTRGQLWKERDADGVATLYQYDENGELAFTALDYDQNDQIDFGGQDRITWTTNAFDPVSQPSHLPEEIPVRRTETFVWETDGADIPTLFSTTEYSVDGLHQWDTVAGLTTHIQISPPPWNVRTVTQTAPDGSYTQTRYEAGRMQSVGQHLPDGTQLSATNLPVRRARTA